MNRLEEDNKYKDLVNARLRKAREEGSHETISLLDAISKWQTKRTLEFPPHQRDDSWSERKKKEYVLSILGDERPPGSFEIYQIIDKDNQKSVWFRLVTLKGVAF